MCKSSHLKPLLSLPFTSSLRTRLQHRHRGQWLRRNINKTFIRFMDSGMQGWLWVGRGAEEHWNGKVLTEAMPQRCDILFSYSQRWLKSPSPQGLSYRDVRVLRWEPLEAQGCPDAFLFLLPFLWHIGCDKPAQYSRKDNFTVSAGGQPKYSPFE